MSARFRDRFRATLPSWARDLRDFLGDDEAVAQYTAQTITYTGSGLSAQQLLAALLRLGDPASVELKLDSQLAASTETFTLLPAGLFVAAQDGYTSTLPASTIFTVI